MGTITTEYIQNTAGTITVPTVELKDRVIQYFQQEYTGGEWNPTNMYNWVPGAFIDFTPRRADSRIRYRMRLPLAWVAAAHVISHFYFIAGGQIYWYWSESGTYLENAKTFEFDVPSWGTGTSRIGLQHRSYANDNHEARLYTTYYWNGTGRSAQNARGHLMIEEIVT
jgi:hypothetical protein